MISTGVFLFCGVKRGDRMKQQLLYVGLIGAGGIFASSIFGIKYRKLKKELNKIENYMVHLSKGDYRMRINEDSRNSKYVDTLNRLSTEYQKVFEELVITSLRAAETSSKLDSFMENSLNHLNLMSSNINELSLNTQEYIYSIEKSYEEIKNINTILDNIYQFMNTAKTAVIQSKDQSASSKDEVEKTADTMLLMQQNIKEFKNKIDKLRSATSAINKVSTTIENIADNTNLLAINASIESARAGEAGKGFGVVAQEIRNMADSTAKSLDEIYNNTNEMNDALNDTLNSTQENVKITQIMREQVMKSHQIFEILYQNSASTEDKVVQAFKKVTKLEDAVKVVNNSMELIAKKAKGNIQSSEHSLNEADKFNQELNGLAKFIGELANISEHTHSYLSEKSIDYILKRRMALLENYIAKCTSVKQCKSVAKEIDVDNFQILSSDGRIEMATEKESIGVDLFDLYKPYEKLYRNNKNRNESEVLLTPIVVKLDQFYAKFAAKKVKDKLIIVEYKFNLKAQ